MPTVAVNDAHLYVNCMGEVRERINFVAGLPTGNQVNVSPVVEKEIVFLQLRKTLELIAFASLTANRDKFAAVHSKFASFWRAKDMLRDLEKVNQNFYPMPLQKPVLRSGVKHMEPLASGFLTKDDFVALYDVSSEFLHVANPFSTRNPIIRMRYNVNQWLKRIKTLLELHVMHLVDGKAWVVQVPEQGSVKAWLAEPQ